MPLWSNCSRRKKENEQIAKTVRREGESRGTFQQKMKMLIPVVYSSPITPSDLRLLYSVLRKDSCGSWRKHTKYEYKDEIKWGWGERRAGSEWLNWPTLISVKHTWSTSFFLFSCLRDESCYRLTAVHSSAVSFSTSACLHHPKTRSGSMWSRLKAFSQAQSSRKSDTLKANVSALLG